MNIHQAPRPVWRTTLSATVAVLTGVGASAIVTTAYAQAPAPSAQEVAELRAALRDLRAEFASQEAARARQIEALQRRLDPTTGGPSPQEVETMSAAAQSAVPSRPPVAQGGANFEIYGFAQADYVQDFKRTNPAWDDTLRPSKIPTLAGQFGEDGQSIISVRQSRLGLKGARELGGKTLEFKFEADLFGVGDDEGQTTFHLQNAWGRWGPILVGQTDTVFMDGGIFPNTVDYWGPPGMVYVRNPQIRYTYKKGPHMFAVAIEKPSDDIDPGHIRQLDPNIGDNIQGDEKIPDLTAHYRYEGSWGHVQLAGVVRRIGYETVGTTDSQPKGHETGWGLNLTSNITTWKKDTLHLGVVYGEGIASYMNDGGVDLAPSVRLNGIPTSLPTIRVVAAPLLGVTAYYDHYWNDKFSTSIGYSQTYLDNPNFQTPDSFHKGEYASINLLYTPADQLLMGAELLWGQRQDKNGASGDDLRLQFTVKYSFSSNDFKA